MARIVIALGGNALQKNGETDAESQQAVARETARHLVDLVRDGHEITIVHGNGPQVGSILLNEESSEGPAMPLDTCVAMSQGEIGYWLQQALQSELHHAGLENPVATVVTQIVVSPEDPAFSDPSKPIGPFYPDETTARAAASKKGFIVKEDSGRGWRRVVASPTPLDILEKDFIKSASAAGNIVVAAGGGGIPVSARNGNFQGVAAVIDKDNAAELVAELIDADTLLILTTVEAVSINYGQPGEQNLGQVTPSELEDYIDQGEFAPGSMLPKIQAAIKFVNSADHNLAIITSPDKVTAALSGQTGTHIKAD